MYAVKMGDAGFEVVRGGPERQEIETTPDALKHEVLVHSQRFKLTLGASSM